VETVGVVGFGRFGRALAALLFDGGYSVRALDPNAQVPPELRASPADIARADFVAIAVPVMHVAEALKTLRPHLSGAQIVFDVASVKVRPSAAMRAVLGAEIPWVATHPLFGPMSLALAERPLRVVVCPSEHAEAVRKVRALYETIGCTVVEQTPEGHDRVMAHTHALTFFVAKGMLDAGARMDVPFAPPSFQAFARAIETVRSDAGHLFSAIAHDNPFAAEARKKLLESLAGLDRALDDVPEKEEAPLAIPDLGEKSFELKEAREHIDALDRDIVALLSRRAELARRAGRAKQQLGAPVLDPAREAAVLGARRSWASEQALDEEAVEDVFRAIMKLSRRVQR